MGRDFRLCCREDSRHLKKRGVTLVGAAGGLHRQGHRRSAEGRRGRACQSLGERAKQQRRVTWRWSVASSPVGLPLPW